MQETAEQFKSRVWNRFKGIDINWTYLPEKNKALISAYRFALLEECGIKLPLDDPNVGEVGEAPAYPKYERPQYNPSSEFQKAMGKEYASEVRVTLDRFKRLVNQPSHPG